MSETHEGGEGDLSDHAILWGVKASKDTDYFPITINASAKSQKSYELFPSHTHSPIPWYLSPPLGCTGSLIEKPSGQRL